MKAGAKSLDVISIKRAQLSNGQQVRYRVYQSPNEFIAVIAESALLAIRLSGVKDPYKVMRDLPTTGAALEKGQISFEETSEKIPLPTKRIKEDAIVIDEVVEAAEIPFVQMPLADIHKKKVPITSVLNRDIGINLFGVSDSAPTLNDNPHAKKEPFIAEPPPPIAAPDPVISADSDVLSQEDVAKLLGDI